jgi:hypothetical protein
MWLVGGWGGEIDGKWLLRKDWRVGGSGETYGLFAGGLVGGKSHLLDLRLGGLLSRHGGCDGLEDRGKPD